MLPALLLLLALAPGCGTGTTTSAASVFEAKAAVDSLWAGYAAAAHAKDAAAFGKLFVEDATLDFSTAPTEHGRDAISAYLAKLYEDVSTTGMRVEADETRAEGSLAVQTGTFAEGYVEKGAQRTEYGRFVLIAERGSDRAWRIRRLVAFADSTR
jgi:uncharacterized protein (TIGR02246 family)